MLELWGGVECTVNRVGDQTFDQLAMSQHDQREGDLRRFAELGLKTLRFPVLWEHLAPNNLDEIDWTDTDRRLREAQSLGLRVIVGFVHHGSGPIYTSLADPDFPNQLATIARAFAERYPWVDAYTPINEPLTTARFSGLYGAWYPHAHDNKSFVRILLHQCQGIRSAMRAIHETNPNAQLIQTEDLGKIFSTNFMAYQATFENHRRWLSFDLLTGRINPDHPLYTFCLKNGLNAEELQSFVEDPCKPDILGINHYITSNRFLDERLERYPVHVHGGNGHHRYADIEAVRVGAEILVGPRELIREAWDRYRLPLAITEVHLGCTREEQMRWFREIWDSAQALQKEGIDLRAVTSWSLLGGFEWNSLVTVANGYYESGVFDLRSPEPRPTALAAMIKAYSKGESFDHPALDNQGWWHRQDRLRYPSVPLHAGGFSAEESTFRRAPPRELLITGGKSPLASALAYTCEKRGLSYRLLSQKDADLTDVKSIRSFLAQMKPWAILHAEEYALIDEAEDDQDLCRHLNVTLPTLLAEFCADSGARLLSFSSDQIFDGFGTSPYRETDRTSPLSFYGRSKLDSENAILACYHPALIIRSGPTFGPWDENNFLTRALRSAGRGRRFFAANDLIASPTYLPDLVDTALDLLIDDASGIWHLANPGAIDWASFGRMGAELLGIDSQYIIGRPHEAFDLSAARPRYSALSSIKASLLPDLERSVDTYIRECRVALR